MAQQTAVEWLDESLQQNVITIDYVSRIMILEINIEDFMELKNKAKQMEKEQIFHAFGVGCHVESKRLIGYHGMAEQYYNETYQNK